MSGGGGKTTSTSSAVQLPAWAEAAGADLWGQASDVADRPYNPYQGSIVAGMTPDQIAAAERVRGVQGGADAAFDQSGALASGLAGNARITSTGDLNQMTGELMSPYTENVVNRAVADVDRQGQIQQGRLGSTAVQAGAFGGDRFGVESGVLGGEVSRAAGDISAQLRDRGYTQAQTMAMGLEQANQQRAMGALTLAPQLAAQKQGLALSEAGALANVGQQFQQQNQTELLDDYRRFLEEQNYPAEMVGFLTGTLNGIPMGHNQTQTQGNSRNQMAGVAGGALQGAAMGTAIAPGYGTAIGAVGGGILGAFA
jgi:hypothetical protein